MIKEHEWIIPKARKYKFPVNVILEIVILVILVNL